MLVPDCEIFAKPLLVALLSVVRSAALTYAGLALTLPPLPAAAGSR